MCPDGKKASPIVLEAVILTKFLHLNIFSKKIIKYENFRIQLLNSQIVANSSQYVKIKWRFEFYVKLYTVAQTINEKL